MKPSITEMEYIPASRPKNTELPFFVKCLIFASACVIIATIIHYTIEPSGIDPIVKTAHAEAKSDRELEKKYCARWATNKEAVTGGTTDQIRIHCQKYL